MVTDFTDADALELAAGRAGFESPDPLPMEVPVHVRGLVTAGMNLGADCAFEPFCEDTLTVLISSRGAVLRLAAQAAPGQEILLSSPSLERERCARVVRYRGHPDVKGYAEVVFTQPAPVVAPVSPAKTLHGVPLTGRPETSVRDARLDSRYAAPAMPLVVTPLADLLTAPPKPASASSIALPVPPAAPHAPRRTARRKAKSDAARTTAAPVLDLEKLLDARQAALNALPSAQQLAARLLGCEQAALWQVRKHFLTQVCAVLLTLGAAGAWAVVSGTSTPSPAPPHVSSFALPVAPSLESATSVVVAPRLLLEPEPVPLATDLVTPAKRPAVQPMIAPVTRRRDVSTELAAPSVAGAPEVPAANLEVMAPPSAAAPPEPAPVASAQPPVVTPPRLVSQAAVAYPSFARQSRVEGDVIIDARVDETGRVTTMRVISGAAVLVAAAQASLAHWRYEPATLNGKPIATHVYVTIQFRR